MRSRAARMTRPRRAGEEASSTIRSIQHTGVSCAGTKPFSPSRISVSVPAQGEATTGAPKYIASSSTMPKISNSVGNRNASARRYSAGNCGCLSRGTHVTAPLSPARRMCAAHFRP